MLAMLTDRGLRQRAVSAARERVRREFDHRALVGRLAAIYREALGGS
jgi:glycosyltransferase involved in cell wall biosynthesis